MGHIEALVTKTDSFCIEENVSEIWKEIYPDVIRNIF